jgi:hypothetical protein
VVLALPPSAASTPQCGRSRLDDEQQRVTAVRRRTYAVRRAADATIED